MRSCFPVSQVILQLSRLSVDVYVLHVVTNHRI
jgi:hypothetical protein